MEKEGGGHKIDDSVLVCIRSQKLEANMRCGFEEESSLRSLHRMDTPCI